MYRQKRQIDHHDLKQPQSLPQITSQSGAEEGTGCREGIFQHLMYQQL